MSDVSRMLRVARNAKNSVDVASKAAKNLADAAVQTAQSLTNNAMQTAQNMTDTAVTTAQATAVSTATAAVSALTKNDVGLGNVTNDAQVIAPSANTDGNIPQWNGTNSKTLKDGYSLSDLISAVKHAMYRIGDIIFSASSTNPSAEYGGTWVAWGQGRVPIGVGSNGTTNYPSVEAQGGADSFTTGAHAHVLSDNGGAGIGWDAAGTVHLRRLTGMNWQVNVKTTNTAVPLTAETATQTGGVGLIGRTDYAQDTVNVVQSYVTCYMWKKTA